MPAPASIVLRELGSPVPAHTCCVSDGAIASMPIEITRLSSNNGRHVMPLFMVFQIPPPAVATKSVFDGPGIPTMSDERPSKLAGPSCRHLMPAMLAESMVCAWSAPQNASAAAVSAETNRVRGIDYSADGRGLSGRLRRFTRRQSAVLRMSSCCHVATRANVRLAPPPRHAEQPADARPSHTSHRSAVIGLFRSEDRRVGKDCRSRWSPYH